jgi:hypothetical protein
VVGQNWALERFIVSPSNPQVSRILAYIAEIRIFLVVFSFIQNSYVRQGYFTALGYYIDFTIILLSLSWIYTINIIYKINLKYLNQQLVIIISVCIKL